MSTPCVIGVDVSTTALKAIAWSREGHMLAEVRADLPLDRPRPHYYEQAPRDWWSALCEAVGELARQLNAPIQAIAIAHQRETICPVDARGEPLAPAMLWLDQRARELVAPLVARIGEDRLRRLSGKAADFGPALYKIAWLREHQTEIFNATYKFCDVQGWLVHRLTGHFSTSWSAADPLSLFDISRKAWSPALCEAAGITPRLLCDTAPPGSVLGMVTADAAAATGLPAGTPVVAAGGDGQAAGVGVFALSPDRAYLNLGTAVVAGVYSPEPAVDRGWRTMTSCAEEGYILESSLRSGALLSDWLLKRVCGVDPRTQREALLELEAEAAALDAGSDGLLLLPYWEGAMNPYWDMQATGCIVGLTDAHGRHHLYRALIEGVALEQALVMDLIHRGSGLRPEVFAAIGGVAQSDLWCQIMADVLDTPVERSGSIEAASLGAGMCAARGAGWYVSVRAASEAMQAAARQTFSPRPEHARRYRKLLEIYRSLYPQITRVQTQLAAFASTP